MSVGIEIRNNFSSLLIDENYKNYVLVQKGTIQIGSQVDAYSGYNINYAGNRPIVAIRPLTSGKTVGCIASYPQSDGSHTSYFLGGSAPMMAEYFVFDLIADEIDSRFGIQVRDSFNRVTFDSNFQYLRIVDFVQYYSVRNYYDGSLKEAAIFATPAIQQDGQSGYYRTYVDGVQFNDVGALIMTVLDLQYVDTSDQGQNNAQNPSFFIQSAILIADVTGY